MLALQVRTALSQLIHVQRETYDSDDRSVGEYSHRRHRFIVKEFITFS